MRNATRAGCKADPEYAFTTMKLRSVIKLIPSWNG